MAKKDSKKNDEQNSEDDALEQHVKDMMDPEVPDKAPESAEAKDKIVNNPSTAPEVTDLPKPEEPLKIKILKDGDQESAEEPATAPELKDSPKVEEPDEELADEPIEEPKESNEDKPEAEAEPAEKSETKEDNTDEPDDPKTDEAVDDIVRKESDELLKAEDGALLEAKKPVKKNSPGQKIKAFFADIWKNPKKRKILIGSVALVILLVAVVPTSRYFILNTVGVRASANIRVIDESTLQPLRNVSVTVHGATAITDENGEAKIDKIRLGNTQLKIDRRAFAPVERNVTVGWGSNPLGEEKLTPTGTQYAFRVTDFLSGKGIVKAEATSGEASAFSNEDGHILLTMEDPPDEIDVAITSEGRRTESLKIDADKKVEDETAVQMVPARKHAYISRREARFDVFAAYADGKEDELVLKGSGSERDDMVLVAHPTEELVALVSTREGERNDDGFLLSDLNIIDLRTKSVEYVESSERIQLIGWYGERLAYVRVVSGSSAANPKRNRIMAYHYQDDTNNELAAANYFNDILAAGDRIYYAPSGAYADGINVSLFSVKADGQERKIVLEKEVWNLFRTDYDHIALSAPKQWYDYRIGDKEPSKIDGEPADLKSKIFTDSPDGEKSLWVDERDGKGVLIVRDVKSGKEETLRTQSGLANPVRWLSNDTVVYRIKTDSETADYAISLEGGDPKKIADVTDTSGIDRWYYY